MTPEEKRARHAAHQRAYRRSHRATINAQTQRYRQRHPKAIAASKAAWAAANPDKARAYRRRWNRKRYAATHPEWALRRAHAIVGPNRSTLVYLVDPLHDELLAEALLAIVEGDTDEEARERIRRLRSREQSWLRKTRGLPADDLLAG